MKILARIAQALVLLAVASSFAGADSFMYMKKKAAGGGSCNPATDYVGWTSAEATAHNATSGNIFITRVQPTCSGELDTVYLYHDEVYAAAAKVCIYNSTAETTNGASDTLIACTAEITATPIGWISYTFPSGNNVSSSSYYWLGYAGGTIAWQTRTGTSASQTYGSITYASPPANLAGITTTRNNSPASVYISIK